VYLADPIAQLLSPATQKTFDVDFSASETSNLAKFMLHSTQMIGRFSGTVVSSGFDDLN
jgi:hypothetical protein